MNKIIISALMAAMAGMAHAALVAYEPFNYAAGTLANGTASTASGFTGNWAVSAFPQIVNTALTYPGLTPTNRAYQHAAAGAQTTVGLASSLSSGTKYISFLFKGSGNSGGDSVGVFFKGNNATSLFCGFRTPDGASTTGFGLGTVNSTTLGVASALGSAVNINNTATHFLVIQIDFNTSDANDTIRLWIDPPANASVPGVAANVTASTFDVGTISAFGINITGGYNPILDEIRVGDSYGDVTGYVPAPSAPTGLVATPGINSVGLNWDATSGATGYKVLRGTSTGVYNGTNTTASNAYTDNAAIGGTQYFYVVQATNSSGASASSSEVSATPTIALPNAPTGLAAVGTNGAVSLSWNAAPGAASYNLKRSTTSGAEVTITNLAATSYSDTGVINGTAYFYTVSATNNAGESADAPEVTATSNVPPPAPTGLVATAGSNQVTLSWTGSAGAVSYNIRRSTTSGSGYSLIGTTTAPTMAYTDSTAVKFTQYFYVVSAVNAYGESSASSESTATSTGAYGPSAYESFSYTLGAFANNTPSTAGGFAGNWTVSGSPTIVAGLTYSNLTTSANAYRHSAAGAQTTVNLTTALAGGTKYISYLFKGSGNSGGDTVGVFFKGNNATSLFAGFRTPNGADTTGFGLGTVNSTSLGGATALGSVVNINNTNVHLIVLKIDFNTSGTNDTVSLWIDPPAGMITPGVAANIIASTFDVGTISAFGINITGGYNPILDEIRVGGSYGDVVDYGSASAPTIPTTVAIAVAQGEAVSWTGYSTNSYQPQKSSDNSNWTNVGSLLAGNAVTSIYETAPQPYYRVLEIIPGAAGGNELPNPSFENPDVNSTGAANWSGPANGVDGNGNTIGVYATNSWGGGTLNPVDGTSLLYLEGLTPASGPVTPPNVSLQSDLFSVSGGLPYHVQFSAANPVKVGGANPQYRISYFTSGNVYISDSGFISFAAAGNSWTTFSLTNTAPANAAKAQILFIQAIGGGNNFNWVTLVDNLTVNSLYSFAGTNVLSPTIKLGAVFIGTVKTNGVTAMGASGTITFLTNNVTLSANTVATGTAGSATATLTPPYTVKAIYSGDSLYLGSTNILTVNNALATVALGSLLQTNDGTAKSVTVVTTPAGLTVNLTYDGSPNAPTNAGTYQVIGTVVDALYVGGATNDLVIVPGTSSTPTNITVSVAGNQLTIEWPGDHLGWFLQTQTNDLSAGLTANWVDVPGSETSTQAVITVDAENPSVFFRLRSP